MVGMSATLKPKAVGRVLAVAAILSCTFLASVCVFVSVASGADVVTEHLYDFGPDGSESTNFQRLNSVAVDQQTGFVYALDAEAGALYKFEADGTPVDWGGAAPYISENEITGLGPFSGFGESQIAVDSSNHVVYVTEKASIRAFTEDGEPAAFTAVLGEPSELSIAGEVVGVAVDTNGNIYVNDYAGNISVFSSTGALITSFVGPAQAGNLAVGPDGTVYVVKIGIDSQGAGIYRFVPDGPVGPSTTYESLERIRQKDSDGYLTYGVGVDPESGDIYVAISIFTTSAIAIYDSSGNLLRYIGRGPDEEELAVPGIAPGVAVVAGGEELQFYVGGNGPSPRIAVFGEVVVEGPPSILSTSAADVTSGSATLLARINPNTAPTTYRFEYGLEDCSSSLCTSVPVGGGEISAGHRPVLVSQGLSGLSPGTVYHYRVIATNSFDTTVGPGRTFITQATAIGFRLPDERAWEMVSPVDKHGGKMEAAPGPIQASRDGNGLIYQSFPSIEADPEGSREWAAILGRREASGSWRSEDISPSNDQVAPAGVGEGAEYKLFSPDLSLGLLQQRSKTLLSPEASERAPYLRENTEPFAYRPLVTGKEPYANIPPGTEFGGDQPRIGDVVIEGASADSRHIALRSRVPLTVGGAAPGVRALYEWTNGQIKPVSVLPAGEGGGMVGEASIGSGLGSVVGALSDDGSRVFWSVGHYLANGGMDALYVRDTEAGESARLDLVRTGASGAGAALPIFQGASDDGDVVFFTDTQQLTPDASPSGADLYRCELPAGSLAFACATLTDLSVPAVAGESADVQGLAPGISHDGRAIYFVAKGVLDTVPSKLGDSATAGSPNLYLWQQGEGVRFIATLSEEDGPVWGKPSTGTASYTYAMSATASPGGRYLAFPSQRSLTGYDNSGLENGEPVQEVFRYDAVADQLDCVSCNPSGARPLAKIPKVTLIDPQGIWSGRLVAASLSEAFSLTQHGIASYRPRVTFDSGRVFFNAVDSLVPADSNGDWDVYQYEPLGVGDCAAAPEGASIARSGAACVALISSGTADEEAAFLDASAVGDDAFFLTPAQLSVLDEDQELDVYDARVDGITAVREPVNECLGEACQPAATPPNDPTPGSSSFHGAGNLHPRPRCAGLAKRSKALSRRAQRARQAAAQAPNGAAGRHAKREAQQLSRRAKALGKRAKRCKRSNRRGGR